MSGGRTTARAPREQAPIRGSVVWGAPFYNYSGYGEEARGFLRSLVDHQVPTRAVVLGDISENFKADLAQNPKLQQLLERSISGPVIEPYTAVMHIPAGGAGPVSGASRTVLRTMFETDGVPDAWLASLNSVDEIWVPSEFNVQTFRASGVTVPLHVVPEGVDTVLFRPGLEPLSIPGTRGTVFLSIFEWTHRKAPDLLLEAWAEAFGPDDDVSLVLRVGAISSWDVDASDAIWARIDRQLELLGTNRDHIAPIVLFGEPLPTQAMPRLMAAADVYLGVSRGEGWGRPQHEAMACGLAVVATRWGGNLEFMNDDNSFLIDVAELEAIDDAMEIPTYHGHHWALPDRSHFVATLERLAADPQLRRSVGRRARQDIERRFQWHQVTRLAEERLRGLSAAA